MLYPQNGATASFYWTASDFGYSDMTQQYKVELDTAVRLDLTTAELSNINIRVNQTENNK